jgi:hypothetical protein
MTIQSFMENPQAVNMSFLSSDRPLWNFHWIGYDLYKLWIKWPLHSWKIIFFWHHFLRDEGITGFYKGIVPNLIRVVPATALTFVVYEHTSSFIAGLRQKWSDFGLGPCLVKLSYCNLTLTGQVLDVCQIKSGVTWLWTNNLPFILEISFKNVAPVCDCSHLRENPLGPC